MRRSTLMIAAAAIVALTASTSVFAGSPHFGNGKSQNKGFTVSDTTGKVILDDGIPDGRGCVIGTRAVFSPALGGFIQIPASKCNF